MRPESPSPRRLAALDVGSLTVRLAVAEVTAAGNLKQLLQLREITALGEGLSSTGSLAAAGMDRTFAALKNFRQIMDSHRVTTYRAVGTQALRQAANAPVFLDRVHRKLGLAIQVLSPAEEARLSLAGVLAALNPDFWQNQEVLVLDVGGGSTEWAIISPREEPVFASLPLGVLILSQARPVGDPPEPAKVAALKADLAGELRQFYCDCLRPHLGKKPELVGTAGAVTTLAAMSLGLAVYDKEKINNLVLKKNQVAALAEQIIRLDEAARGQLTGLEPAKAGVMVAGVLIVLTILEVLGADSLVVVDAGLLEGVLQEVAGEFSVSRFA